MVLLYLSSIIFRELSTVVEELRIREAEAKDLESLVSFNLSLAEESENLRLDSQIVRAGVTLALGRKDLCRYFVAELEGKVIGQTMVTFELTDWLCGINWWIQSVYVESAYRGRGVFKGLYRHIKELAFGDSAVPRLRLYVEHENVKAIKTYEKLGMERLDFFMYQEKLI